MANIVDNEMEEGPLDNALTLARQDVALDEALAESFPASDPVAISFPQAVTLAVKKPTVSPESC